MKININIILKLRKKRPTNYLNNKSLNTIENQKYVVDYLIRKFNQNSKPYKKEMYKIASKTKCTYQQILKWYSDERYKMYRSRYFPAKTIKFLLEEYEKQRYPSPDMIQIFANKLNLTKKQIARWFNKKRYKNSHVKSNEEKSNE
jgi:hypothetical protein